MNVNDILDYVKYTPNNTNPNVLSGMLESFAKDSADFTNLKGYKVEFKQWPGGWVHCLTYVQTDGTIHEDWQDQEVPSDIISDIVLLRFYPAKIDSAIGLVKKLDGTIIDLSTLSVLDHTPYIPLSNIEVTYSDQQN